ncbi:hypothetical protein M2322_004616 [Rhodoblastus acidophilus]|uniref:gas vesicle protein GvpG n=1 Tax=Rhodoblastus acidophilus TaxID=1074 RepID=UPI0022258799|nr:gas vesicle protein GvpG [Rhodoblastus acidophilus]MCW2319047.1 hypothetical protein [Rhodoblastus acidophilus]
MGLLSTLLTLPVSGPLAGARFVAEKLTEMAEAELHDPEAIKAQLVALEGKLNAGEISEDEFEAQEHEWLLRLKDAMKRRDGD